MAWKKDLAQLKQDLKTEDGEIPRPSVPKPVTKPAVPRELEDEDALFLAAMGNRPKTTGPSDGPIVSEGPVPAVPVAPSAGVDDFREAMASLKGVKAVEPSVPAQSSHRKREGSGPRPRAEVPPVAKSPQASPEPAPDRPSAAPIPTPDAVISPEVTRPVPQLIQLAAGMAIEVDGTLDLRGHSSVDAMERLKERILDGHTLGWRTLHITLGPSEELRQSFTEFLAGQEAHPIARYAQAPVPMGGAQAWILYYGGHGSLH